MICALTEKKELDVPLLPVKKEEKKDGGSGGGQVNGEFVRPKSPKESPIKRPHSGSCDSSPSKRPKTDGSHSESR